MEKKNIVSESSTYHALPGERTNINRRKEIIKILKEGNQSVSDLLKKLDNSGYKIKESALRKDIESLKKDGYIISRHKRVYSLENIFEESKLLSLRDKDVLLQGELTRAFFLFFEDPEKEWSCKDISEKLLCSNYHARRNILNVLLTENMIVRQGEGRGCKYKYNYIYNQYELPSKDILFRLLAVRFNLPKDVYNIAITQLTSDNYFVQNQRNLSELNILPSYIKILNELDYKKTPISFQYKKSQLNKNGLYVEKKINYNFFLIGLIVYVEETGRLYLVGKPNLTLKKKEYIVLHASDILWDTVKCSPETKRFKNQIADQNYWDYFRSEFNTIKEEMFVISSDKAEKVVVYIGNEYDEDASALEQRMNDFIELSKIRPTGQFVKTKKNGDIIYYDTIRGMSDFAKYIRQYGASITIKESARLRKQISETAKRTIDNYKKYDEGWNND